MTLLGGCVVLVHLHLERVDDGRHAREGLRRLLLGPFDRGSDVFRGILQPSGRCAEVEGVVESSGVNHGVDKGSMG